MTLQYSSVPFRQGTEKEISCVSVFRNGDGRAAGTVVYIIMSPVERHPTHTHTVEKGCCLVDNGQLTSLTAPLVACRFLLSSPGRCVALLFLSFFFILRATQSPRAVTVDDKYTNADSSRSRAQFHLVPFLRLSLLAFSSDKTVHRTENAANRTEPGAPDR